MVCAVLQAANVVGATSFKNKMPVAWRNIDGALDDRRSFYRLTDGNSAVGIQSLCE